MVTTKREDMLEPAIFSNVNSGGGKKCGTDVTLNALIDGSLTDINSSAESVRAYSFYDNNMLQTVDFPNVTSIGDSAFYDCSALTTADFPNATSISNNAFSFCSALATVNLPEVTSIDGTAFYGCSALTTADFPKATSIGGYAFYECSALTAADFSNITSIGENAFSGCSALTALILRSSTLCILNTQSSSPNIFNSTPIKSGTGYIYVPKALVAAYKSDSKWSAFSAQIRALEDYTIDGTITGELDADKIGA